MSILHCHRHSGQFKYLIPGWLRNTDYQFRYCLPTCGGWKLIMMTIRRGENHKTFGTLRDTRHAPSAILEAHGNLPPSLLTIIVPADDTSTLLPPVLDALDLTNPRTTTDFECRQCKFLQPKLLCFSHSIVTLSYIRTCSKMHLYLFM